MNFLSHTRALAALALLAALAVLTAFNANSVAAQEEPVPDGALLVIFDDEAGPYRVKITQSPAHPIIGTLRLIVEPVDAVTGKPVENALVRIFGTPPENGERQFSPGLNSPVDRSQYFGQLELDDSGLWTLDVEIDGELGRSIAITQTTINERARSGSNTLVGTILFILISTAFVGAGLWLWYSSKKARKRRDSIREAGSKPRRSSG